MEKKALKEKILKIAKQYPIASIGSITAEGNPWVRYMATEIDEELNLWTTSFASSRKISQIEKNDNVHAALGADPACWQKPYINMAGKAEILIDPEVKKKYWNDMLSQFFTGPDDPNYVVIKITPKVIEYMCADTTQPEIYEVNSE